MGLYLFAWVAITALLLRCVIVDGARGGFLTLSYYLLLSIIHVPGAFALWIGGNDANARQDGFYVQDSVRGFQLSVLALACVALGAFVSKYIKPRNRTFSAVRIDAWRVGLIFVALGGITWFLLVPVVGAIPSATALISPVVALLPIGACICLLEASDRGELRPTNSWLRWGTIIALCCVFPILTMMFTGFLGYGVTWSLIVISFMYVLTTRKATWVILSPLVVAFGLSAFVTYFGVRPELRSVVWSQGASISNKYLQTQAVFRGFEVFDLSKGAHLYSLTERFNQNHLVGLAASRHDSGAFDLALGGTVPMWSLVPRVLWPGKPDVGGSGELVATYTGLSFNSGTSVGIGQVFEFYVNFGTAGVVIGSFLFGLLLGSLDAKLMFSMRRAALRRVITYGIFGVVLLQPGGSMMEIIVGLVGAFFVVSTLPINWFVRRFAKRLLSR
jgi:hypothetical protein